MVETCCGILSLDSGSLLVGVATLIMSALIGIYSIVLLGVEGSHPLQGAQHFKILTNLDLDSKTVKMVLSIIILIQVLWMLFSVLMIVGLKKNRSSYLLGYFAFGIVMVILMILSGILVLLKQHWILSLLQFISACIYIHGLIVVYHYYEVMQNRLDDWPEDEDQLWRPDEDQNLTITS